MTAPELIPAVMKSGGAYNDASEQQAAGNARALRYDFAALFQLLADTPDCYVDAVDNVYAPPHERLPDHRPPAVSTRWT